MSDLFRIEARTILNHNPEDQLKIITQLLKNIDYKNEVIQETINTLSINIHKEDLEVEDIKELLEKIQNDLYKARNNKNDN